MALEDLTGTKYLDDLVATNPAAGDNVSEGDDHIRGIKNVLKLTFPNVDAACNATPTEFNYVDGVTSAIQTQFDAITANDWVTAARMADNSVDSDMYVDGSIDLAHMSSESVDEDNLHISNAGSNGQFLAKQSGNAGGLTWTTVTSEDYIPDGSVMAFFQAGAPTGWTKLTSQNDKMLRVVSGDGGGTGGGWAVAAGTNTGAESSHTHTVAAHGHSHNLAAGAHTLSTSEMPSHTHSVTSASSSNGPHAKIAYDSSTSGSVGHTTSSAGSGSSHSHSTSGSVTDAGAVASGAGSSHLHTIAAPQYIDVIICSKDA